MFGYKQKLLPLSAALSEARGGEFIPDLLECMGSSEFSIIFSPLWFLFFLCVLIQLLSHCYLTADKRVAGFSDLGFLNQSSFLLVNFVTLEIPVVSDLMYHEIKQYLCNWKKIKIV